MYDDLTENELAVRKRELELHIPQVLNHIRDDLLVLNDCYYFIHKLESDFTSSWEIRLCDGRWDLDEDEIMLIKIGMGANNKMWFEIEGSQEQLVIDYLICLPSYMQAEHLGKTLNQVADELKRREKHQYLVDKIMQSKESITQELF